VPALRPYLIEPIWEQFRALLPERQTNHPLGCHRPRIPDRTLFEKLVRILGYSVVPTSGSPTNAARQPPCAVAATSGSKPE
jgi:transposase